MARSGRSAPLRDIRVLVFCDFDGTIMQSDTCLELCARFTSDDSWRAMEEKWQEGSVGSIEMAQAVLATIHTPLPEILLQLERGEVSAGFMDFARHCLEQKLPLIIVSDGYDAIIKHILARLGLSLPIYANTLFDFQQREGQGLSADFPHANPECSRCACCKRTIITRIKERAGGAWQSVLIGDGRSDYCAARIADIVFAKDKLAALCQREGIPFSPWNDFTDILTHEVFTEPEFSA